MYYMSTYASALNVGDTFTLDGESFTVAHLYPRSKKESGMIRMDVRTPKGTVASGAIPDMERVAITHKAEPPVKEESKDVPKEEISQASIDDYL